MADCGGVAGAGQGPSPGGGNRCADVLPHMRAGAAATVVARRSAGGRRDDSVRRCARASVDGRGYHAMRSSKSLAGVGCAGLGVTLLTIVGPAAQLCFCPSPSNNLITASGSAAIPRASTRPSCEHRWPSIRAASRLIASSSGEIEISGGGSWKSTSRRRLSSRSAGRSRQAQNTRRAACRARPMRSSVFSVRDSSSAVAGCRGARCPART